jgi:hypothetical protein
MKKIGMTVNSDMAITRPRNNLFFLFLPSILLIKAGILFTAIHLTFYENCLMIYLPILFTMPVIANNISPIAIRELSFNPDASPN